MIVLACALVLGCAFVLAAMLTASILLGLLSGSLAAVTLQGTRELAVRMLRPKKTFRRPLALPVARSPAEPP